MMHIQYHEQQHYDFASEFLNAAQTVGLRVQTDAQHLIITVSDTIIGRLLQRISENSSVILPDFNRHRWLISGKTYRQIEQARIRLQHFLVPTYAQFADNQSPQLHIFDAKKKHLIQQLGSVLYPDGYYVLESEQTFFPQILKRLDLWMQLEAERPQAQYKPHYTYSSLYERFRIALAAKQWQIAEEIRHQIQALNLTSADNLLFLEIEQWAQQERWLELGKRSDFSLLACMYIPRAVRAALLTAFHVTYLLPYEQQGQWQQALESFREELPRLGYLLTSRLGLTQEPVVQVYAYQAVLERNWITLKALAEVNKGLATQTCITQLLLLLGPEEHSTTTILHTPAYLAHEALNVWDYDAALHYTQQVEEQTERAALLLLIAFHLYDARIAEDALLAFWECSPEEQEHLQERHPFIRKAIDQLQKLISIDQHISSTAHIVQQSSIQDWLEWLAYAQQVPDDSTLVTSLERIDIVTDERFWSIERIRQLSDALLIILNDSELMRRPVIKEAWKRLVNFFLAETTFPCPETDYDLLYETLYNGLLESKAKDDPEILGFLLLRLAEALLKHEPRRCSTICKNLEQWCESPLPVLESWVLEAFELLVEYGLIPSLLITWYRTWVSYLIVLPGNRDRVNLELWLAFGQWIHPGDDLIKSIETILAQVVEREDINPLSLLPVGYSIGIFCLRSSSAERAKSLLLECNAQVNVRICSDEVLTRSAQSLAEHVDLAVIVTTCLTHALTYGISPYLKHAIAYPQSSGSTSILRAIEEYARATYSVDA